MIVLQHKFGVFLRGKFTPYEKTELKVNRMSKKLKQMIVLQHKFEFGEGVNLPPKEKTALKINRTSKS